MIASRIRCAVLGLALAACADKAPKTAKLSDALPHLPLPPQASFVDRTGGPDALQITVRSPARADVVEAYYRKVFTSGRWRLVNDAKDAEGATVLFAQQDGPPLWVRIQNAEDGRGSVVELSGAVMPPGAAPGVVPDAAPGAVPGAAAGEDTASEKRSS
ncbi:MAG: hypothetical protein M3Q93_12045 [Gemmatimonadota bacterium]|nr:hypothetical protein [Gemmatimonadota bacterium]